MHLVTPGPAAHAFAPLICASRLQFRFIGCATLPVGPSALSVVAVGSLLVSLTSSVD